MPRWRVRIAASSTSEGLARALALLNFSRRSPGQVTRRLDDLIDEIRALQSPHMRSGTPCDVVLFAHGHLLRAFVKRWLRFPMAFGLSMML